MSNDMYSHCLTKSPGLQQCKPQTHCNENKRNAAAFILCKHSFILTSIMTDHRIYKKTNGAKM